MAKVTKSKNGGRSLEVMLSEYLVLKQQISDLEKSADELKKVIFANPEKLPKKCIVDFGEYEKEFKLIESQPRVDITYNMLKAASVDPEPLLPFASFSATMLTHTLGKGTVERIKATDLYTDEAERKSKSYFYKG